MFVHIEHMNRPVLLLDDAHPAKRFLIAFMDCRANCVGRELGSDEDRPIDQAWESTSDGKTWTFSEFAYKILSFDIELDGFLQNAPSPTPSEILAAENLPLFRSMMHECADAARQSGNAEILELTDEVLEMITLWEQYLSYREEMISQTRG
jgi:hypothetical protein